MVVVVRQTQFSYKFFMFSFLSRAQSPLTPVGRWSVHCRRRRRPSGTVNHSVNYFLNKQSPHIMPAQHNMSHMCDTGCCSYVLYEEGSNRFARTLTILHMCVRKCFVTHALLTYFNDIGTNVRHKHKHFPYDMSKECIHERGATRVKLDVVVR